MTELKDSDAAGFSTERIGDYLIWCNETGELSWNTINTLMNAQDFYYSSGLKRERMFIEIPQPNRPLQLQPLSEGETSRHLDWLINKKRKAILFTVCRAPLWVRAPANLEIADIDRGSKQIFLKCHKGKKDMYVTPDPILPGILGGLPYNL